MRMITTNELDRLYEQILMEADQSSDLLSNEIAVANYTFVDFVESLIADDTIVKINGTYYWGN